MSQFCEGQVVYQKTTLASLGLPFPSLRSWSVYRLSLYVCGQSSRTTKVGISQADPLGEVLGEEEQSVGGLGAAWGLSAAFLP